MSDILGLKEAADLADCTEVTMAAYLRSGRFPGIKVGRSWRVPRAALVQRMAEIALEEAAKRRKPKTLVAVSQRRRALVAIP